MKRICDRPIQIDALTICYEVVLPYYYDNLSHLKTGECLDINNIDDETICEFSLYRIEGRYFDNVYSIRLWINGQAIEWGYLKFNIARGVEESNLHTNGNRKVWISLSNKTLYTYEFHCLTYIEQRLGLTFHNVTCLDLALDTPFCVSTLIKKYAHSKDITTILNGKRILNRDEDRPELNYTTSGSLNNHSKYLTVCIKQRNAIKDKTKGITVQAYDKAAEISNASNKQYIMEYYGNPKRLYRTEIHLNAEEIKNYIESRKIAYTPMILFDKAILEDMFFHFIRNVIRFQCHNFDTSWGHILGRW